MGGLKNRDSNLTYLRLKEGKFYKGKDAEQGYEELEGLIVKMYYRDEEYEGTPVRKLNLVLQDGKEKYHISINVESQNYSSLISFLKGADLSKPVTLHPKVEVRKDGEDAKRYSMLVSQDGTFMKGYFTKANPNGLPEWEKVKVGKKIVYDKTEYLDFLETFVKDNYISKLDSNVVVQEENTQEDETEPEQKEAVVSGELPWED